MIYNLRSIKKDGGVTKQLAKISNEIKNKVLTKYKNGLSVRKISKELKLKKDIIKEILEKENITQNEINEVGVTSIYIEENKEIEKGVQKGVQSEIQNVSQKGVQEKENKEIENGVQSGVQSGVQNEIQTISPNGVQEIENKEVGKGVQSGVLSLDNNKGNYINDNFNILMEMIEMYKDEKKITKKDNDIYLELPIENDKDFKTSIRVNKIIWEQFKVICKEQRSYTQKELVSMAFKEYLEKYN